MVFKYLTGLEDHLDFGLVDYRHILTLREEIVVVDMNDTLFTLAASVITGVSTFFIGRQRARKEIETMTLVNVEKSLTIYQTIIQDLKEQVEELLIKVNSLEDKVDELKKENHELKQMLRQRNKENK